MTTPAAQSPHCRVVGGDKLPAGSGGAAALCATIERAVAASGVKFTVNVRVVSASRLAATLTANGRVLPQQNFASMDRNVDARSFERFAAALADQAAKAR